MADTTVVSPLVPGTSDFGLGVIAERVAGLQTGLKKVEDIQRDSFMMIKEMRDQHTTIIEKHGRLEERVKATEDVVDEHDKALNKKADKESLSSLNEAVEDLKISKAKVIGIAVAVSTIVGVAVALLPVIFKVH
jgi:hypothetical protein